MDHAYFLDSPLRLINAAVIPFRYDLVIEENSSGSPHAFPLSLPVELAYFITRYLSLDDLRVLALVDKSCLKLARSVLFCIVTDPLPSLMDTWALEGRSLHQPNHRIGPWVRRLAVIEPYVADGDWHPFYKSIFTSLSNLTHLTWNGSDANKTPSLLGILMGVPLRALSLDIPLCEEGNNADLLHFPEDVHWRLEHLDIFIRLANKLEPTKSPTSLLRLLMSKLPGTLQSLSWRCPQDVEMEDPNVLLPNLQSVFGVPNCLPMSVFTGSRIRHLSMDITLPSFYTHHLILPTLRTLEWINTSRSPAPHAQCVTFLHDHLQLEFFSINSPLPNQFLETELLPLLSTKFHSLISLRLGFEGPGVPVSCLVYIGLISTLRALWVSAAGWAVDHGAALVALHPLLCLEDVAFTGDTYRVPTGTSSSSAYYDLKLLPVDVNWKKYFQTPYLNPSSATMPGMAQAWELWHMETMLEFAQMYAENFPALRECFLGQLPMRIDEIPRAAALVQNMRCGTTASVEHLRKKWGLHSSASPWKD